MAIMPRWTSIWSDPWMRAEDWRSLARDVQAEPWIASNMAKSSPMFADRDADGAVSWASDTMSP